MRTTSKNFKRAIRNHINQAIENGTIVDIYNQFLNEKYSHPNEIKYYKHNKRLAFKDWLTGLPTNFTIEFDTYTIECTLEKWYNSTGMDYNKEKLTDDWYYHLVIREFISMLKEQQIDF